MFKFQLTIVLLLFSFAAGSSGPLKPQKWERVKDVVFESPSRVSPAGYGITIRLFYDKEMRVEIIVVNGDEDSDKNVCALLDTDRYPNVWDVNGRIITYEGECDDNVVKLWPKYKNETKYIIDEFLTKTVVHLGPTSFGTKGFIDGYSEVLRYASYLD
tara:strand:+ start:66035 stop:66508 length:474 start_codon:yes stop_codon:yes gene_type:complete